MLERATACLKAGARDSLSVSLRCPSPSQTSTHIHIPRSQRMLHSTFWAHGAGDLDLPPWALPSHLPPSADSSSPAKASTCARTPAALPTSPPDALFLDFLYPPQALAWLHRANAQHFERWERRNARRLPEGFKSIASSRGYSSQSYKPFDPLPAAEDTTLDTKKEQQHMPATAKEQQDPPATESLALEGGSLEQDPETGQQQSVSSSGGESETEAGATDAPQPEDALHTLRRILTEHRRGASEYVVKRAWSLYSGLDDDDKRNALLTKELLLWLRAQGTRIASAHCISLYWSLPLNERPLEVYQAALQQFLDRKDYEFASGLHREALSTIPNSAPITNTLFEYALRAHNWPLTIQTYAEHEEHFSEPQQARHRAMFWFNVAELHDLVELASPFIRLTAHEIPWLRGLDLQDKVPRLATRLAEESILKLARAPFTPESISNVKEPRFPRSVLRLVEALVQNSPKAKDVLEVAIRSILQQSEYGEDYANAHVSLSHMYRAYRDLPGALPSEDVLEMFLQRLKFYWGDPSFSPSPDGIDMGLIAQDCIKFHGRLSFTAIQTLLRIYSGLGDGENVRHYTEYAKSNLAYEEFREVSHSLVYMHARRGDLPNAVKAFEEVEATAKAHNDTPSLPTWNSLFYAHSRADDVDGAFALFKKFLAAGMVPDYQTIHPITQMLAIRGDVDGIDEMMRQYTRIDPEGMSAEILRKKMNAKFLQSRLTALVHAKQVEDAEDVLKAAITEDRRLYDRRVLGDCCNTVLAGYARRPNIAATMRIYKMFKLEKIRMDTFTYSSLMQALAACRQTGAARKILTHIMPRENIKPRALHYAILMTGFTQQKMFLSAASMHRYMLRDRIRPTVATQRAYMRMKLAFEHERRQGALNPTKGQFNKFAGPHVMRTIQQTLESFDPAAMTSKGPRYGADKTAKSTGLNELVDFAMYHRGRGNKPEIVEKMFRQYQDEVEKRGLPAGPPPMRILIALMNAHYHGKNYDKVEKYWKIAKDKADMIAPSPMVPDFVPRVSKEAPNPILPTASTSTTPSSGTETGSAEADKAELGFSSSANTSIQHAQTVLPDVNRPFAPRPAPGMTDILTRPLALYLKTLAKQNRINDIIKVPTQLLSQGYRFDVITWNRLIEYLCNAPESPVLLAFILAERYLMAGFSGWTTDVARSRAPFGARYNHSNFMKNRYENKDMLRPQYRTLLHMARALRKLEEVEAKFGLPREEDMRGLAKLRGSVSQIREQAPQVISALDTLPLSPDKWQERLLRGGAWERKENLY